MGLLACGSAGSVGVAGVLVTHVSMTIILVGIGALKAAR